jgi:hypothetical protein
MDIYTYITLFVLPLTLFNFCLEFLPDPDIPHGDELKLGIFNFIHHLIYAFNILGAFLLPFLQKPPIVILILVTISTLITLIGYLINNDYCWITKMYNTFIDPKKINRKWCAGIESNIKNYLRGDDWAYSDMVNPDNTNLIFIICCIHIFILLKYLYKL